MSIRNNHALAFFYEKALLVAECDAMPDHLLVCYKAEDKNALQLAMENANARYGQGIAVQENLEKIPGYIGFWLPTVATPLYVGSGEPSEPEPTQAAQYLDEKVKQQKIPALHAHHFTDLHAKLPHALAGASAQQFLGGNFLCNN